MRGIFCTLLSVIMQEKIKALEGEEFPGIETKENSSF